MVIYVPLWTTIHVLDTRVMSLTWAGRGQGNFPDINDALNTRAMDGNQVWTSRDKASFGLGSYLLADGMFYVLEGKTGILRLLEANTTEYKELASAAVLTGPDVWAPLALSDGKLLVRDMAKMVCLEVGGG